jgi:hypothetical protein
MLPEPASAPDFTDFLLLGFPCAIGALSTQPTRHSNPALRKVTLARSPLYSPYPLRATRPAPPTRTRASRQHTALPSGTSRALGATKFSFKLSVTQRANLHINRRSPDSRGFEERNALLLSCATAIRVAARKGQSKSAVDDIENWAARREIVLLLTL